jgi:hypothetical protein
MNQQLRNFIDNKQANFFYSAVIIVIILFVADITWVVSAMVQNRFLDSWALAVTETPQMQGLDSVMRNVGAIVIVIINIGLIVLLIVSAWKRQTVEAEDLAL